MLLRFCLTADKEIDFDKPIRKNAGLRIRYSHKIHTVLLQRQRTGKQDCHKPTEISNSTMKTKDKIKQCLGCFTGGEISENVVHRQLHLRALAL